MTVNWDTLPKTEGSDDSRVPCVRAASNMQMSEVLSQRSSEGESEACPRTDGLVVVYEQTRIADNTQQILVEEA